LGVLTSHAYRDKKVVGDIFTVRFRAPLQLNTHHQARLKKQVAMEQQPGVVAARRAQPAANTHVAPQCQHSAATSVGFPDGSIGRRNTDRRSGNSKRASAGHRQT
jgi:hypothetical protein